MSLSSDRSEVIRLHRSITDLQKKSAEEGKKAAEATKKANAAGFSASKASSVAQAKSYYSTMERENRNAEAAQAKQAGYTSDIARKMIDLGRAQEKVSSGEEKERRDQAALAEKQRKQDEKARTALQASNDALRQDLASLQAQMTAAIEKQAANTQSFTVSNEDDGDQPYDFFISHAWADKKEFVDGLVAKAKDAGLRVWYDRQDIAWGDSIRQKIDAGLSRSYFGVVVLSPNFFDRPWPQAELDAIVHKDLSGQGRLLPIWHRLTQDDVLRHAPTLAGRLALTTALYSTDQIVSELTNMRDRFRQAAT